MRRLAPSSIRVLLANMPELLAQIVESYIDEQQDMVLMGRVQGNLEILMAARQGIDIVLLGSPSLEPLPGLCSHLLHEFPLLKVIVITTTADAANACYLGLKQRHVESGSPQKILTAIRDLYDLDPVS